MQRNFRPEIKRTDLTQSNSLLGLRSRPYDGKIAGLYDLEETLGRGHFAVVKLARHVFTGEKVAVKVIDKSKLDEVSRAHLFQEVRCMKLVQHPNVVRLYEVIDTATKLYLVLELGDGGDLYEYILKHDTGLPEKIAKEYFTQIVRAISYCHQLHVVHRDLKPENVVFFKNHGIVKLTDFGFSNKFYPGQKLETSCGSLAYSAPEILLGDSYDAPAVDVWSLGVILYMLVCGQPPFQEANDSETLTMIMDCKYDIPAHVSDNCRKLISRMLVKNPDKRATLLEITSHPWLTDGKQSIPDMFPLVSKEQLSEEDHNLIVQKIVNGNIATKEEILDCLEKNEYNHVTATYYLLAERKLKSKVQEQLNKNKRPDQLSVSQALQASEKNKCTTTRPYLSIPRTPGDLPQRSRKCSIVQEDEEEGEDISPCARQETLGEPLIRRGSRSEGRLNLAVQERIAESEGRKSGDKIIENKKSGDLKIANSNTKVRILKSNLTSEIPKVTVNSDKEIEPAKYNNEIPPSSQIGTCSYLQLNEIFEESEMFNILETTPRKFLNRNQMYEKRKLKFHKNRTASCSSSDASDDDSEKRKKQAEKLNSSTKSFQGRRDSHDDSSDSQETGASAGSNENKKFGSNKVSLHSNKNNEYQKHKIKSNNNSGKKNMSSTNLMVARKHKFVKKKSVKTTHLKENQSLNRITEVQEDGSPSVLISTIFNIQSNLPLLVADKAIDESFLKDFISEKYSRNQNCLSFEGDVAYCSTKYSKKYLDPTYMNLLQKQNIHDRVEKCNLKKNGILSKYFHVKKKICIALPELFNKTPLHQAQSYSSLTKKFLLHSNVRPTVLNKKSVENVEGETNQNEKNDTLSSPNEIKLNSACQKLTKTYSPHVGNASKCYN